MTYLDARLAKLLAYHEHAAQTIRATMALLNGHSNGTRLQHPAEAVAVALDRTRRQARKKPRARVNVAAQREASARFLAQFDTTKPSRPAKGSAAGYGSLIRRGYLVRKGDGYIRSSKPYVVVKRSPARA